MKLWEILLEAPMWEGYWTVSTEGSRRVWIPVFSKSHPKDALFPFVSTPNMPRSGAQIRQYQAFTLLPSRTLNSLSREEKELLSGLEDALKQRSSTDIIPPTHFQSLSDRAVTLTTVKAAVVNQDPKRLFVVTPPSSSPVAENFAKMIQSTLKIPNEQAFYGHFSKRDVVNVIDEVEASTLLPPKDKEGILARLYSYYRNRKDTTFKIKDLWTGHRIALMKAGIDIFDLVRSVDLTTARIPYLIIVDDNVQSGSTATGLANKFIKDTGVTPNHIISLAMFKYP